MTFKDWSTLLISVVALGLGIWNRIEQWREHRRKLQELEPWAELKVRNDEVLQRDRLEQAENGERNLEIIFHNTRRWRIHIFEVELVLPITGNIFLKKNDAIIGNKNRNIKVDWTVIAEHEYEGKSRGMLFFNNIKSNGDVVQLSDIHTSVHFEVICRGREVRNRGRSVQIAAATRVKQAQP